MKGEHGVVLQRSSYLACRTFSTHLEYRRVRRVASRVNYHRSDTKRRSIRWFLDKCIVLISLRELPWFASSRHPCFPLLATVSHVPHPHTQRFPPFEWSCFLRLIKHLCPFRHRRPSREKDTQCTCQNGLCLQHRDSHPCAHNKHREHRVCHFVLGKVRHFVHNMRLPWLHLLSNRTN